MPRKPKPQRMFIIRTKVPGHLEVMADNENQAALKFIRMFHPSMASRAIKLQDGTWHGYKPGGTTAGLHLKMVPPFTVEEG